MVPEKTGCGAWVYAHYAVDAAPRSQLPLSRTHAWTQGKW